MSGTILCVPKPPAKAGGVRGGLTGTWLQAPDGLHEGNDRASWRWGRLLSQQQGGQREPSFCRSPLIPRLRGSPKRMRGEPRHLRV